MKSVKIVLAALCLCLSANTFAQSRTHKVASGESLGIIARNYGVSVNDILKVNPDITNPDHIKLGQAIKLPANAAVTPKTTTSTATTTAAATTTTTAATAKPAQKVQPTIPPTNGKTISAEDAARAAKLAKEVDEKLAGFLGSGCKEMYRIEKKDNLTKIAAQFNLTIDELLVANPPLTRDSKIKKGNFLCIPFSKAEIQAERDRIIAEQKAAEAKRLAELEAQKKRSLKHIHVGVVLPLKAGGDLGGKMVEFYRGLLMAADSVKQQGISVDVHAFHSGNTIEDINFVLSNEELKKMDFIFGPVNKDQAVELSNFCKANKVRLVMPFATTNTVGLNNPYCYQASANGESARQKAAQMVINKFSNHNFVIMTTDAADNRGAEFTKEITSLLETRGLKYSVLPMNADANTYAKALNAFRDNIVIPDASSLTTTSNVTKQLMEFTKENDQFHVTLMGYPEWPTYTKTLGSDFHALDTYAYTTFYRNPEDDRAAAFEALFKQHFNRSVSQTFPRYGDFGFDLGYYFINGLAKTGDFFDQKHNTIIYRPFQNGFQFEKAASGVNQNHLVNFVHYTNDHTTEIIK